MPLAPLNDPWSIAVDSLNNSGSKNGLHVNDTEKEVFYIFWFIFSHSQFNFPKYCRP